MAGGGSGPPDPSTLGTPVMSGGANPFGSMFMAFGQRLGGQLQAPQQSQQATTPTPNANIYQPQYGGQTAQTQQQTSFPSLNSYGYSPFMGNPMQYMGGMGQMGYGGYGGMGGYSPMMGYGGFGGMGGYSPYMGYGGFGGMGGSPYGFGFKEGGIAALVKPTKKRK